MVVGARPGVVGAWPRQWVRGREPRGVAKTVGRGQGSWGHGQGFGGVAKTVGARPGAVGARPRPWGYGQGLWGRGQDREGAP